MTKQQYIEHSFKLADQYVKDVLAGKIVCSKWIKLAVERSQNDRKRKDIEFKKDAVSRVYEFFSFLNINIKNQYRQFALSPYQAWILAELFGWYYAGTTRRRFRYGLIYTARKSGKSVFAVGIQLYMQTYDREINPEVYIVANSREQANHTLDYAKEIVKHSPVLNSRLEIQQYRILSDSDKYGKGVFYSKAYNPKKLDSLNVFSGICDEFHEYPDMSLYNVLKSGTLSRENPLILVTSTAGFDRSKPFHNLIEIGKKVLSGELENDNYFYALYTLDDEDNIHDPANWIKSNPNIGVTISLDVLIAEYNESKLNSETLVNFITKNLNVYTDSVNQWVPEDLLIKSAQKFDLSDFEGEPCFIGVDLSKTRDLTSVVLLFEREGMFYSYPYFFCAKDTQRIRQAGIDITPWIREGHIIECDKRTIDHDLIFEKFKEIDARFDVQIVLYDKYNASKLMIRLQNELGLYCEHFPQTFMYFNYPVKFLEEQFFNENIIISDNPAQVWNIRNVVIAELENNVKITKNKSLDSVDGAISLAQAIAGYLRKNLDPEMIALDAYSQN